MDGTEEDAGLDFEALFHEAPAGYVLTLTDGTITEVNRTFAAWTGRTPDQLRGTSLLRLLPGGDRIMYSTHALPQLDATGTLGELGVELLCGGGQRRPVLLTATRSQPGNGRPAVDRIIMLSAPERRLYEQELVAALEAAQEAEAARARAEAHVLSQQAALEAKDRDLQKSLAESRLNVTRLKTILNTVDVGVVVVDKDGNEVLINARQQLNLQRAAPHSGDHGAELLVFGSDRVTPVPAEDRPIRRAVSGQSFSDQLVWTGEGDEQQALSVSAQSMKQSMNGSEAFEGSVIAYSDVTRLVKALSAKDDFVANVSHELRTPLASIIGYLDLALDEAEHLPVHVAASLRVVQRNSERLLQLVSDLLSTGAGVSRVELQSADLSDIVRASITSAAPRAEANAVQLIADIPPTLPATIDPHRISQVVDNLLSNAVKYSPDGGPVTVHARRSAGTITLQVSDHGIGMTKSEQAEVFNKFFRSGSALRAAIPGVGLGLVITKKIVEAHQGTITLVSRPGEGTVFTVTLPG